MFNSPTNYLIVMQNHLEFLEEEPLLRLVGVQVVEKVSGREPEGVELARRRQQQDRRCLLIVHARVVTWEE